MPLAEAPRVLGFVYGLIVVLVVPYLLIRGKLTVPIRLMIIAGALLSGIILFAPMTPFFFLAGLYQVKQFNAPLFAVIGAFSFFIVAALVLGRSFCGYACPIGAIQELPYYIPVRKWMLRQSSLLLIFRGILVSVCIVLALLMVIYLFAINFLLMRGVRDIFLLSAMSIPVLLFMVLVVFSAVLYRPFCRFACPYGALMSIAAWNSLFRISRTSACIGCGRCEGVCPTGETLPGHQGNECYLCGRCIDVCPVDGGIAYIRRNTKK